MTVCRANDSKYGLQAGVFTHDLDKAWHAFEHLEVGGVVWNHVPSIRVDAQVSSSVLINECGQGRDKSGVSIIPWKKGPQ